MRPLGARSSIELRARALAWNGPLVTFLCLALATMAGVLLTELPLLEGAALVGLLAVIIGTLIEPFVGLGAALFVGPLKAYLSAEVPQIPAQVGHAFVALALTAWLMKELSERDIPWTKQRQLARSPLFLSLVAFFGAVLLSLWDAVGLVAYGVPELIKWIEIILLFIFVKEHIAAHVALSAARHSSNEESDGEARRLWWLIAALVGTGVFQALLGIWQFGLRDEGPEHFRIRGGNFFRAYGTFEQPNPYAGYLALTTVLLAGTIVGLVWDRLARGGTEPSSAQTLGRSTRPLIPLPAFLLGSGAALLMLVALIASWSRGAWMGFGAAALAMAAALPRKAIGSVILVTALVIGGAALHASGQLPASFIARLTTFVEDIRLEDVRGVPINDANYAVVERLAHWQAALSMFRHRLWTGVGFGCYEAAYPAFALVNWPIALGHAHNIYLNLAAETGLIGLTAYLMLWGVVFWQTWRATRRARGLMRGLAIGLLGAWTHISVHHLLDNLYVNNIHLHIGVLLGLAAFIIQHTNRTASSHDR